MLLFDLQQKQALWALIGSQHWISKSKVIHIREMEGKGLACWVLYDQNSPAYLLPINKHDNITVKCCFFEKKILYQSFTKTILISIGWWGKDIKGEFHLHLLVFPFVYKFNSRIRVLFEVYFFPFGKLYFLIYGEKPHHRWNGP